MSAGVRADDVRGRSYAPRGRTPVVRVCRTRIKPSPITAAANKGELRWMIVDGAVNAPTFLRFLERLIRDARGKVFLIVDRLKAHRARLVRDWLEAHRSEIELHYLPSYSPEPSADIPRIADGFAGSERMEAIDRALCRRSCRSERRKHPCSGAVMANMVRLPIRSPSFGRTSPTNLQVGRLRR
jgi:hypothetical protein